MVLVHVDVAWSCCWSDDIRGHLLKIMSQLTSYMFVLTFSPETVPSWSRRPPSSPPCQLCHQRMPKPLPPLILCVLKSANFTQRQQLHSHTVQHQHHYSESDKLQTQLRAETQYESTDALHLPQACKMDFKCCCCVAAQQKHELQLSVALCPNIGPQHI